MEVRSRDTVDEDVAGASRPDTLGTHTWWLLTASTVGATNLVLNIGVLPPGTAHQLHRHAHAEQALLVVSGHGVHLRHQEEPIAAGSGDAIYIPANEWHGFANPFDEPVTIASIYGGVGRREAAGYELRPGPPFDIAAYRRSSGLTTTPRSVT